MSKFNPDFWEVTVSQEKWGQFSNQDHPYYEDSEDLETAFDLEFQLIYSYFVSVG